MKIKNICIGAGYLEGPTLAIIAQKTVDIHIDIINEVKFNELYRIAFQTNEKMKLASAKELLADLEDAINAKDNLKQWNVINQLRKLNIKPPDEIIRLLKLEMIHPVVKTTVFNWLFETEYPNDVEIMKFDKSVILN